MNYIDVLLFFPLAYAAYKGFKSGFILQICTLLALLVGIYAGINFSDGTANLLKVYWNVQSEYLPVIAFTLTFLGVGALVYFGGKALEKVIKIVHLTPMNKMLGVLFSLLKMLYFISVFFVILESFDEKSNFIRQETKEESLLFEPVRDLSLESIPRIKESTIFLQNSWREKSDSTGLNVQQLLRAKEVADSLGVDASDAKELKRLHDQYAN